MKLFTKSFPGLTICCICTTNRFLSSCPAINAQAGTGASTTICSGQCASLTATVVPVNATTTYSVGSITYSPYAFTGGTLAIGEVDDVWSSPVNIGFNFCYFGSTFNQLLLGSNGEITFDLSVASGPEFFSVNQTLPDITEHPVNTICGAYRDIDPSDTSLTPKPVVNYYVLGTAPCRVFVANWTNVPLYRCQTPASTFQIVLHESTNIIEVFIENSTACPTWQNGRGIIGIQDGTGTTAVAPASRNTLSAWTATNEAWQFMPTGAPNYTVNWAGSDGFTATGLTAAPCPTATTNYTATMNVANCGGGASSYTSVVQVSVTPTPSLVATASPTAICRGSSTTLTASGSTSYTWSPGGATTASISVTPTVSTTYTVSGSNGSCVTTQTVFVRVNLSTTITATSNPTIVCSSGSATLTSTGATTYTWNPGGLTGNTVVVTPTVSTQFTVVATNSLGCTTTRTLNLNVSAAPSITASASATTVCAGSTVTLSGAGGTSYTWTPGPLIGTNVVVTPTANTTYTVRGRNAAGCTATNTIAINTTPGITVTASASPTIICRGGSSTLTATGASTYTWNPGALTGSTVAVTPTATTVYSVTGSDLGCTNTRTVTVAVSTPTITATKNPTASVCAGSSATLSATGATTYTWNPGAISGTPIVITPTATTLYTVTGTNALGCTGTRTINVAVAANPTVNAVANPTTVCAGISATLSANGATSYTWNPGPLTGTNVIVTPTTSTTYTLRGRNAAGCIATNTVTLNVTPAVTVTPVSTPSVICSGGSSTLSATGATSYTWNPGAIIGSSVSVNPTVTTTYSVTGVNASGCTNTRTVSVTISTVSINATSNPTILCSSNTATLTATGASTYTWNPGASTGGSVVVTPTATTIYTVTGTNTVGCTITQTLNLNVGTTPTIGISASSNTICEGAATTLTATGGTSYTWNPGGLSGATVTVTPVTTTIYTVTGTNASGCEANNTVAITVNPTPTILADSDPVILCSGQTATLNASGASTYTWNPGAMSGATLTVSPMVTTVYTVTATSSLGCIGSGTVNLKVSPNPTVTASASPSVMCEGNTATLTANGATSYTWNPGALTGSLVTVSPTVTATYSVSGNNGLGCLSTQTITVTVNAVPTITASSNPMAICAGSQATLTAAGATNYTWNPGGATTASIVDSPTITTTYTVSGDNASGCIGTQTVTVNVSSIPSITVSASSNTVCAGSTTTLSASGASTYTWNPGALTGTTVVVTPTTSTTYTVDGDNGLGCVSSQTIDITTTPGLTLTTSSTSNTLCAGSPATLTIGGASTYTWNPGAMTGATVVVTPTTTTTYTINADNGAGCTGTATLSINVDAIPTISISATSTLLCSAGTITLTAIGAASYTWMPLAAVSPTVFDSPSVTTTYTVTGDNGTGCIGTETITVNVSTAPTVTVSATSNTICAGSTVTLTSGGASTYTWNPGALTGTNIAVSPTVTTTYTVDGDNGAGCIDTETITVNVIAIPSLSISASSTVLCSAGSITLTASGGTTYTWNPGGSVTATIADSPTITTTYTVSSDNAGGCIGTQTITVNVGAAPSITITAMPIGTICAGTTATLTASGAAGYTWNPTAATTTVITDSPSTTTTYTVTGDNGLGCTATNTFVLDVAPGSSITAVANPTAACANSTINLSASGATTYTWLPMGSTGASVTATPSVSTTYTALGDNGTCIATATVFVNITSPQNVTATVSGDITCLASTVDLFGNTTSSPVVYLWTGPNSYTSTAQNPTGISEGGLYTLGVVDLISGCVTTATVSVVTNTTIPGLVATTSGNLGCASTVTLNAASTTTNTLTYAWSGPSSFTSAVQSPTASVAGNYTVSVSDALTGCNSTATVSVGSTTITPTLTATVSGSLTCTGNVTLTATASGAGTLTYTWSGPLSFSASIQNPTTTVAGDYTVSVTDGSTGCNTTTMITVGTNTIAPDLTATVSSSLGCVATVTLNAASTSTNSLSYAWSGPSSFTSAIQNPTTSIAGDYTVIATDALTGCSATASVTIGTNTVAPTLTASVSSDLGCTGSVTLTASSTTTTTLTYAWSGPSSFTASVQSPTTTISGDYTVTVNDIATGCSSTTTITVGTNTVVPDLTASASGSVGCTGSVTLTASSTNTNTTYAWSGPSSFTTAVQNPTINITGDYTVTVTDAISGCTSSTVVSVGSNSIIPIVGIAFPGPVLGCNTTVTLSVITAITPTLTFDWSGPSSFTAAIQNPTTSVAGDYTVTVTDPSNGCQNTAVVSVGFSTVVPVYSATITSATCTGSVANNDGTIQISGHSSGDTYDISQAPTYTGTATYATATTIPFGGVLTNTLVNPSVATPYTIRVFSNNGCFKDTTVMLSPTSCTVAPVTTLGMTKAVSTATFINNNAYNVTYTIVATNASAGNMTNFSIIDNLNNTFPLPTTFSVITPPVVTSINSSLTINAGYDGSLQTDLLSPLTSTLGAGKKDTIVFTVQINPNGFFGPFNNSAIGSGIDSNGIAVADSSNTGFAWDPDNDGDPTNNDIPTTITLNARPSIGVAKIGSATVLTDKTIDVTYIITVKNLGNDTLRNVQVLDSLIIPSPAQYTIKSGPSTSSGIAANSNYNGISDIRLLDASLSKLAPGQTETITFVLNITPNAVRSVTNSAIGLGLGSQGPIVRDTSNTGSEPDPNGNLNATENGENIPTVVALPDVNLFIPEVFTPDGDGRNDFFVIKGIEGRTVKLTVFNRWGSKVYSNDAYDNTWAGVPNVSGLIIGSNKLPQGTYYYIVEFEDGADDPVNGYVVLQY